MTPIDGFLPLIKAKAHAGFLKNTHEEEELDDFEYYRMPGFNPTKESVLIEVEGDSMQPTVMSGDILICQTQKNYNYVLDGTIVILVTEGELITTRVFKHEDENYFQLESDNVNIHTKKEIRKSEVNQLLLVLGKVSNVLVPKKEVALKGKIKSMEESLDLLKKEVFKITKKLGTVKNKETRNF